jgi:ATP-dependent DNA ligase
VKPSPRQYFTRRLSDVMQSVREAVRPHVGLPAAPVVLEGEAPALDRQKKLLPFYELVCRFRRIHVRLF